MITVRPAEERGHANHGWLDTYHSFSFADYYDPEHSGFRTLRVINEDVVAPGQGFGLHPHKDMEIVTYIVKGQLAHKDTLGSASTISRGKVQRITAGRGISHSEFNASASDPVHLLQIWITPERKGLQPSYEERSIDLTGKSPLTLVASPTGESNSITINQDTKIYAGVLAEGKSTVLPQAPGRAHWIQLIKGNLRVNGTEIDPGDGVAVENEPEIKLEATADAELLVFDLK